MRILSIANFKGGTGKTATAVNLAAIFARDGQRVLLIDADAQHNATDFYLDEEPAATLTDVLEGAASDFWPENVTPTGREGLDLLAADMGLLRLDLAAILVGASGSQRRFADLLETIRQDDAYDWVIIDCPPSFTAASVAALVNSDEVLLPTRLDAYSRRGVLELIEQVQSTGRFCVGARYRVLVTMADRSNLSRQGETLLRRGQIEVCRTVIRSGVAVGESSYARQPLCEYAPKCKPALDYEALALEIRGEESPTAFGGAPFPKGLGASRRRSQGGQNEEDRSLGCARDDRDAEERRAADGVGPYGEDGGRIATPACAPVRNDVKGTEV